MEKLRASLLEALPEMRRGSGREPRAALRAAIRDVDPAALEHLVTMVGLIAGSPIQPPVRSLEADRRGSAQGQRVELVRQVETAISGAAERVGQALALLNRHDVIFGLGPDEVFRKGGALQQAKDALDRAAGSEVRPVTTMAERALPALMEFWDRRLRIERNAPQFIAFAGAVLAKLGPHHGPGEHSINESEVRRWVKK